MNVHIVGEVDERLALALRRRLLTGVEAGLLDGAEPYICVAVGDALPETILDDARVRLMVLVEPGIQMRDNVLRTLASRTVPPLEIVEHVSEDIQADRTWAMLLSLLIRQAGAEAGLRSDEVQRSNLVVGAPSGGSWTGHSPLSPAGLTIGFLGFGPMARAVAARAGLSGMRPVYWPQFRDRAHVEECETGALRTGATMLEFADLLAAADVLVLDLGFTPESIRILDAAELAMLRSDAFLVNTSHGRVIDEGALIQTLRAGHLAGVALDRFNYEPLPADSPLRVLDRVNLTPGIAIPDDESVADETARRVALAVALHEPEVEQRSVRRQVQRKRKP